MGFDLSLWKALLRERFQRDRGATLIEADQLRHRFDDESALSLQAYIDKKIRLYNESGDIDEDAQARRLVQGLDSRLAKLLSLRPTADNTLQQLKTQIASREHIARRDWQEATEAAAKDLKRMDERMDELDVKLKALDRIEQREREPRRYREPREPHGVRDGRREEENDIDKGYNRQRFDERRFDAAPRGDRRADFAPRYGDRYGDRRQDRRPPQQDYQDRRASQQDRRPAQPVEGFRARRAEQVTDDARGQQHEPAARNSFPPRPGEVKAYIADPNKDPQSADDDGSSGEDSSDDSSLSEHPKGRGGR